MQKVDFLKPIFGFFFGKLVPRVRLELTQAFLPKGF